MPWAKKETAAHEILASQGVARASKGSTTWCGDWAKSNDAGTTAMQYIVKQAAKLGRMAEISKGGQSPLAQLRMICDTACDVFLVALVFWSLFAQWRLLFCRAARCDAQGIKHDGSPEYFIMF
jgi:hypothetical protein